ncbi:U32 family peptidase [Sebaldella sp. S0638]|uniref:peptidase U32 family protein n=1 Tax=Sebaldella sp. S0638 TaxID=2957809 RepID=UPI0020A0926B|nr:U32 family peptidase [Sebaldella sp. S0638]MCP1222873.1 U32 family peptidase [Sebaldella sp. S0638]
MGTRKIELLAPAGNLEKLQSAFHFGADACYIGGNAFNLRGMSANFKNPELEEAVKFAHSINKKIYITLNIFAHNKEIDHLPEFIKFLAGADVDGVIVADLGVFQLVREIAPDLDVHVSTQANNTNWRSVKLWKDLGAKRVILAREMSLEEIKEIREKVPDIQLEVFVHGAMCMAVSGRCLLSNYFTARDANRGVCAQSCRWNYKVVAENRPGQYHDVVEDEDGTFIFNAKDLCTIEFIDKVIETGVDSLKIEGRMKSIYYNSIVVKQYREAIDLYLKGEYKYDPKWLEELQTISHRLYSQGFYLGKPTEDDQNYNTNLSYSQTYQLVANVLEKRENNQYLLQIRNRLTADDEVELVRPTGNAQKFRIKEFLNTKNDEIVNVVHPNTLALITADLEMEPKDLLRVKLPVGESESDIDKESN